MIVIVAFDGFSMPVSCIGLDALTFFLTFVNFFRAACLHSFGLSLDKDSYPAEPEPENLSFKKPGKAPEALARRCPIHETGPRIGALGYNSDSL